MSNTTIALIGAGVAIGAALFTIFVVVNPRVKGRDGDNKLRQMRCLTLLKYISQLV